MARKAPGDAALRWADMTADGTEQNHRHLGGQQGRELLARVESDAESIAARIADELLATIPGYEGVSVEALAASAKRNFAMSIRTIQNGREPSPEDVPEADDLAYERLEQGVPLGSLLSGFRRSMVEVMRSLVALSYEYRVSSELMLEWSTLLWSLGDVFATRATAVYRDREIDVAIADSARRSEWIGRAVAGRSGTAELLWGAAMYDVPNEIPISVFAAAAGADTGSESESRLQDWARRSGVRILSTVQSNAVVGIVIGEPDLDIKGPGFPVGLGGPAPLSDLSEAFAEASLVLRAAEDLGIRKVVDAECLSWRLALHRSPETTDLLRRRYLDPLRETGPFAQELVESVRAYLNNRMNAPAAAKSIPVHVNTLRYRLRRFEELTGADLGDVESLIEISWVLADRSVYPNKK